MNELAGSTASLLDLATPDEVEQRHNMETNFNETTKQLTEITCKNLDDAMREAGNEVASTGGNCFPVTVFKQGRRRCLSGAFPMFFIKERLRARSPKKHEGLTMAEAMSYTNRPEDPSHSKSIAAYLKENLGKDYILPPLTINIQQPMNLYVPDVKADLRGGFLVVAPTAKLAITDGQHRRSGVEIAFDMMTEQQQNEFYKDSVAVMITCEAVVEKIHQDFADCSKTKALPPSLVAVYDQRNPANRLVIQMEQRCPLFKGRVDPKSKSLSSKSSYLFLANQLRQFVKELLAGSYAIDDASFDKIARDRLSSDEEIEKALNKYVEYINYITERIPELAKAANAPLTGTQSSQIEDLRMTRSICLTATGLNVIGRIGHQLFKYEETERDWRLYADKLATIDWGREGSLWKGTILQEATDKKGRQVLKILTQQAPLKRAVEAVRHEIGLFTPSDNHALVSKD